MKPRCPDCNHPVDEHADFFCMHINCYCNVGKRTANALYECSEANKKLAITVEALNDVIAYSQWSHEREIAEEALKKIGAEYAGIQSIIS